MAGCVIIGLDGGSFNYLTPLMRGGFMPNLAAHAGASCRAVLRSTVPPFTIPAWASFHTGRTPGDHGLFSFRTIQSGSYHVEDSGRFIDSRLLPRPLIWDLLARAGARTITVNVPLTYPPFPVNGALISGMLTPSPAVDFTYPAELKHQLDGYMIDVDYLRAGEDNVLSGIQDPSRALRDLTAMVHGRRRAIQRLTSMFQWDVCMVVFTVTDRLCHFFWHELGKLASDPAAVPFAAELREVLVSLDQALGDLFALPGTHVMVLSDHGFDEAPVRFFYVNAWLRRLGLFAATTGGALRGTLQRAGAVKWLRDLAPAAVMNRARATLKGSYADIVDWPSTKAYFMPLYTGYAGIAINRQGVKPQGSVRPGDYEPLRDVLIHQALRLKSPEGFRLVRTAHRREELFAGANCELFPDVVLRL
ncbi:alkaline phosphatase family protein, partial [bacterium]|nr:alkaline phosphatase family protein [candidate division CSSED10-310 bacterium]